MKTVVITGSNRGVGLALAHKFLQHNFSVICACRNPNGARELWELEHQNEGMCELIQLDLEDDSSVAQFAKAVSRPVDILINNAGVLLEGTCPLEELPVAAVERNFKINVAGTIRVTQAMLSKMRGLDRPVIANISSQMGSISDNTGGRYYAYRISKVAVNMFTKSLAVDFPEICSLTLHPGWVATDMGGSQAPTTPLESATGLFNVITGSKLSDSGKFFDFNGKEIPW